MKNESEPLDFLEKSHCVPIILALYRKGMMNRNQLYDELGETINIVIKRIHFLEQRQLVFQKEMRVKPFAKYLGLTGKGQAVAMKLLEIEKEMEMPGSGKIGLLQIPFEPNEDQEYKAMCYSESNKGSSFEAIMEATSQCPKCKSKMLLINDRNQPTWICFKCGTKEKADDKDIFNQWIIDNY